MKNVCHLAFKLNGEDIKEVSNVPGSYYMQ